MKVTKEMHNKELQPNYSIIKLISRLLINKFGVRLLNANSERSKAKDIDSLHGDHVNEIFN